jgi:hypothetical protein
VAALGDVSIGVAQNLPWVLPSYAADFFAGAVVDDKLRVVTVFVPEDQSLDEASDRLLRIVPKMIEKLRLAEVDERGAPVEPDKTTYRLALSAAPRSATQLEEIRMSLYPRDPLAETKRLPDADWQAAVASRVNQTWFNPATGTVVAGVIDLTDLDQAIAKVAFGDIVKLEPSSPITKAVRQSDSNPHYGAAGIVGPGGRCTAGYTVTANKSGARKMLTSGHCGNGAFASNLGGSAWGSTENIRTPNPDAYDFQSIGGQSYNPTIYEGSSPWITIPGSFPSWSNTNSTRVVKGSSNPGAQTAAVTIGGAHYGSKSGYVIDQVNICNGAPPSMTCGLNRMFREGGVANFEGDSGAPVYIYDVNGQVQAIGIYDSFSSTNAFYTQLSIVNSTLGTSLVVA